MVDYCQIDGQRIAYAASGDPDAPAIILIHGWGCYHGVWKTLMPELADRFYCIAVDLLGFGHSDKPAWADYSMPAQAKRIVALADALDLDRFALLGHSMGGQISLTVAACTAPDRVAKLVVVAPVVSGKLTPATRRHAGNATRVAHFPAVLRLLRAGVHRKLIARQLFIRPFYDFDAVPFDLWRDDREMALLPGGHIPNARAGEAMQRHDLTAHLSHVTAPTLVIYGRQDAIVPVSESQLVAAHVPGAEVLAIDRCGHYPMYEYPDETAARVHDFLAQTH